MDKQQSDHIENRIQQAAQNITPPFNEEGWRKMEMLLDKEFNKERRRGFIWWWYGLFVCLIIGAGLFYYQNNGTEKKKENGTRQRADINDVQKQKETLKNEKPADQTKTTVPKSAALKTVSTPEAFITEQVEEKGDKTTPSPHLQKGTTPPTETLTLKHNKSAGIPSNDRISKGKIGLKSSNKSFAPDELSVNLDRGRRQTGKAAEIDKPSVTDRKQDPLTEMNNRNDTLTKSSNLDILQPANKTADSTINAHSVAKTDSAVKNKVDSKTPVKLRTPGSIAQPGLYFLASISSDASNVQKFTLDNRKPVYGIGVGYRFNNRVSLQTGFYAGRKIYSAGPTDYKAKANSYISRYKIMRIEADCIIYELPLSLRYDVIAHKNFRVYATAGLSSFIMKRENYKYHLTGTMGYVMKDSTYRGNTNFFSSAGLSIGVEQKLFNSLYIQAEPYLRLPISGVGEGNVKLYSAGLQVGIKYQRFKKSKKK